MALVVKNPPTNARDMGLIPGSGRSLGGAGLATHSSIFVWRIPCTEKPEGLQSFGHKMSDRTEAALHDLAQIRKMTPLFIKKSLLKLATK